MLRYYENCLDGISLPCRQELLSYLDTCDHHLRSFLENDIGLEGNGVYVGTGGIAWTYFYASLKTDSESKKQYYISQAEHWLQQSSKISRSHMRFSFLEGFVGILTLKIIIAHLKKSDYSMYYNDLISKTYVDQANASECELLYGRSGWLYGIGLLVKFDVPISEALNIKIQKSLETMIQEGRKNGNNECSLIFYWHNKQYYGAAHGIIGILYILLVFHKWLDRSRNTLNWKEHVQKSLNYLMTLQFPSGNVPSSAGSTRDELVQWCHGAPGWISTFMFAGKLFDNISYTNFAITLSSVVWSRGLLTKGVGLCHGIAGNGYVFVSLYNYTKDITFLNKAYRISAFLNSKIVNDERFINNPDRPSSLYEGLAGAFCYLLSCCNPQNSWMIGWELPDMRW